MFLYTHVLGRDLDWLEGVIRAKRPRRLPVVLSREEVRRVLRKMTGISGLLARLMYGTGMRAMESLQLRVKDVDFAYRQIIIREGKGNKDRVTPLTVTLVVPLQTQLEQVRDLAGQELLGHRDMTTTMIYTHVVNRGGRGVKSPLDGL